MKTLLFITSIILCVWSCQGQSNEEEGLSSFDLSPNDKSLVFSYTKDGNSSIYQSNTKGDSIKKVIPSDSLNYINPRYSKEGTKIVFIGYSIEPYKSNLYISNNDGTNRQQLTFGSEMIIEATFSNDGENIYYTEAKDYEKGSPLGIKTAHNFDIYKLNLKSLKVNRITNLSSYGISNLSVIKNDEYLLFRLEEGLKSGIYFYSLRKKEDLLSFTPKTVTNRIKSYLYDPIYSNKWNKIAFTAPYELHILEYGSDEAKLVCKANQHLHNVRIFSSMPKILFKGQIEKNSIRSINLDGSDLEIIKLDIKN